MQLLKNAKKINNNKSSEFKVQNKKKANLLGTNLACNLYTM